MTSESSVLSCSGGRQGTRSRRRTTRHSGVFIVQQRMYGRIQPATRFRRTRRSRRNRRRKHPSTTSSCRMRSMQHTVIEEMGRHWVPRIRDKGESGIRCLTVAIDINVHSTCSRCPSSAFSSDISIRMPYLVVAISTHSSRLDDPLRVFTYGKAEKRVGGSVQDGRRRVRVGLIGRSGKRHGCVFAWSTAGAATFQLVAVVRCGVPKIECETRMRSTKDLAACPTMMASVCKAERDGAFRKVARFGHLIELKRVSG